MVVKYALKWTYFNDVNVSLCFLQVRNILQIIKIESLNVG